MNAMNPNPLMGASDKHKVCHLPRYFSVSTDHLAADVEPEDLDLGNQQPDDLALDVDADMADDDPDALDSDDDTEEQALDKELGLDSDDADGRFLSMPSFLVLTAMGSTNAYCSAIFITAQR
jgi:hypothetical protein